MTDQMDGERAGGRSQIRGMVREQAEDNRSEGW